MFFVAVEMSFYFWGELHKMKTAIKTVKAYLFMFSLLVKTYPQRLFCLPIYVLFSALLPFVPILFSARIIDSLVSGKNYLYVVILILLMCICGLVMEFTVELINEYDVVWDACFAFETTGMILKKYMELDMADMETEEIYAKYNMANAKEIRFHHLSGWLSKKISGFVEDHQSIIRDSFHNTSVARRPASFSYAIQKCIVYIYVGLQLLRKTITAGEFTQYISAVELISTSLVSIISALLEIRKNHKLADRYYNFLDICDKEATAISLKSGMVTEKTASQSGIEIRDVWFRYAEGEDYVLKGLSLYISEGETLSMVGRNGCGKTTLIKLILRLCQPERGVILLNGKNIYEYDYDEYCKLFSVIFQDFKIFSFTVLDNILMEDMPFDPVAPKLSSKQQHRVDEAIRKADFVSAIEHMPNGIYNYINKNYVIDGYELSGGMQQTLAMCRAYYRDAGCIILDEPTAMLDASSESKIYENFNSLIGNKTAIYISHRMSSSRFCDHIAYIENGIVQEYGTHDELIHLNGLYATLFQTQAKLFEQNSV